MFTRGVRSSSIVGFCLLLLLFLPTQVAAGEFPQNHRGLDPTPLVEWFGGRVTSGFHDPARPYHSGIDFGVGWGTPIPSTWDGTVICARWYGDFGNTVIVQNGDWQMQYSHLSRFNVGPGQRVQVGTVIGLSGNTGVSTGAHLHYEVHYQGMAVDPMTAPGVAGVGRPAGSYIELHIYGQVRPDLWTVVQWQAPDGSWHDVEGWQGTPDEVTSNGMGKKMWWVAEDARGAGPFRWLVYQSKDSRLLDVSGMFYLPCDDGKAVIVAVWTM